MKTDFCLLDHLAAMRVGEFVMVITDKLLVIELNCLSLARLGSPMMKGKA